MLRKRQIGLILMSLMLLAFAAGCKKKGPAPPPPPPPPAPKVEAPKAPVIAKFVAEPSSIERGQSSTLSWSSTGATELRIDNGVGTVQADGTRQVSPTSTTTYTLTATGPGGTVTASATVTVTAPPPPPPPPPAPPKASLAERLAAEVQDVYFDYDKSEVRSDARDTLTKNAAALKTILGDFPNATVVIEGHCDERGSAEYNLGLGDRRSTSTKDFLTQLGVSADRVKTISYGKERPTCTDSNEGCWSKNRRAHFAAGQ